MSELKAFIDRERKTEVREKRILTLDGAGAGALSELLLLRELMKEVGAESQGNVRTASEAENEQNMTTTGDVKIEKNVATVGDDHHIPRPCEYFDLIAGSGMGGLVAIMLGRLGMVIVIL